MISGRRNTRQRAIILEELKKLKTHPSAEALLEIVKKRLPNISFATVYRNLNLLRLEGKILQLSCGKDRSRYDGDTRDHSHFICIACEGIFDIFELLGVGLDDEISKKYDFDVSHHSINFYGYCANCKKSSREKGSA
jgi:Fe2+ or Zn2+ uptake regulation protein